MFVKILSVIALIFQAAIKIADFLAQEKKLKIGRELEREANEKAIMERAKEAEIIRNDKLDDGLLLAPDERVAGGVQDLSANIFEQKGSGDSGADGNSATDKSAQYDMGEELFIFSPPKRKVTKVFIHCSDSDHLEHDRVEVIDSWHKQRGWSAVGYHYYIDKSGIIWPGRSLEKIPAAQAGHNKGSIAICCGGRSQFSVAQYYKLEDLCLAINYAYLKLGQTVSFHGHCEVACKTCPNFDYKSVLSLDEGGFIN